MMDRMLNLDGARSRLPQGGSSRRLFDRCVEQHARNGRGFWPAVMIDGELQVIRFEPAAPTVRWTPETGALRLIPAAILSPADWPKVCFQA